MSELDIDFIRSQFPAFSEASLKGQAFFENAGGSYTCGQVIDRLYRFYRERKVQPYHPFPASELGGSEMDEARDRMAAMLNVQSDELSFGPSTTQNTYVLAQAFRKFLTNGDAIIVTNQDHEANSGPWRRLGEEGIEIREWQVDPDSGHLDPSELENLLDEKVKLVCFPHCSNIVGEVNPVRRLCDLAHGAGAYVCVDGVSYAPHGFPDVDALGPDIYLFSSYKTYGPHQGIMVVRRALAEALPNQGHFFNAGYLTKKFTPAGPDHAQIAASAGMADYVDAVYAHHFSEDANPARRAVAVHDMQSAHEKKLLAPVLEYLRGRNDVRILGPDSAAKRVPTVAMELDWPSEPVAAELSKHAIMCGGDNLYAVRLLEAMGIDPNKGALRVSFVHYTSQEEIDHLIKGLDTVL